MAKGKRRGLQMQKRKDIPAPKPRLISNKVTDPYVLITKSIMQQVSSAQETLNAISDEPCSECGKPMHYKVEISRDENGEWARERYFCDDCQIAEEDIVSVTEAREKVARRQDK